ncbi:alpha/beta fold hydrolase [Amycolatopsis sp. NPDC049691]|uniref:alpha/beta fold hydrolase n=1 Tax=Amycolatopsis sp. NPDC049691 TaxID=3155155 RepID=UPI0034167FA7
MTDTATISGLPLPGLAGFTHRWVDAEGIRLHAVEGGRPGGPAVVLLAGFPQTWWAWRKAMPGLAARFRVIAIDLPGQGHSDRPHDSYDTHTVASRIQAAVTALDVPKYWLVAHDIGAWVAFSLALAHEERLHVSPCSTPASPASPSRTPSPPTPTGRGRPGTSRSTWCPSCPKHCSPVANATTSAGS